MKNKKAFTILEIIIVVIIISVLTTLALPRFTRFIEGVKAAEALAGIVSIRAAMERYYLMNGEYGPGAYVMAEGVNLLGIDNPGDSPGAHFRYFVSADGPSYLIFAERNSLNGGDKYLDHKIMIGCGIEPNLEANGKSFSPGWHYDNKIYWDAADIYKGAVPK